MPPLFAGDSPSHPSMIQGCGQRSTMRFAAPDLCANRLSGSSDWIKVNRPDEVPGFNMTHQVLTFSFAHLGFAPPLPARSRSAAEVPNAMGMVKLKEGLTLISRFVGVKPHEKKCGMPVKVVFEKLSDEVTLPKFRPRNSP